MWRRGGWRAAVHIAHLRPASLAYEPVAGLAQAAPSRASPSGIREPRFQSPCGPARSSQCFCSAAAKKPREKAGPRPKDELLRDARHHDVPVRRKAIKGLGKHRDDNDAIEAIAVGLGDEDVAVQLSAQAAMAKVADKGDGRTVRAALERVGSACEWTRIAGLSTLADITEEAGHMTRGTPLDLEVDAAVRDRLGDEDWGVRRAAMDTMAQRAPRGCPEAIAAARRLLEDQMGTVRESAIKAIAALVPRGSREAIDWIAPRLDDWHESVRRAAVVAVAKIAEEGDQHAIELEKSSCDDRSWIVRKAATDSLAKTATQNDLASLRKLARMLEDFDPLPRMAAIYGIAELCGVGHRKGIRLAEARLEHRDPGTRQACVQLLEKITTNDNDEIYKKVEERLEDEDEHVRDSAYYALIEIKKNKPGRRKWVSDLPDLSDLDRLGFDSSDDEDNAKEGLW
uniref:HEAT repeat domain-containing protein n=1 Tax=Alexandrium monilatum TaxID=311494 RepID=A0A7S4RRW5_9DINO|mmetsp:Transcript_102254/g.305280  ORF Transcript_102254/g.305280 Transcript_102254/m.305280 type:complete len:455 (-) Transcript_102254:30-1394(-)